MCSIATFVKTVCLTAALFALCGCKEEGVIAREEMAAIISEMFLVDQVLESNHILSSQADTMLVYPAVMVRYGHTLEEFEISMKYYMSEGESYKEILKDAMSKSDAIRIKYASKYASSSNYWKYSIGQNQALDKLGVVREKRALEAEFRQWVSQSPVERGDYEGILDSLELLYMENRNKYHTMTLWEETFWNGSDIVSFVINNMMGVVDDKEDEDFGKVVKKAYKDIDVATDKRLFAALLRNYREQVVSNTYLPEFYATIDTLFAGNYEAHADHLYSSTMFSKPDKLESVSHFSQLNHDPMIDVVLDLVIQLYKLYQSDNVEVFERKLGEGIRTMNRDKEYYPDANFTLRLSYGMNSQSSFTT